MEQPNAVLLCIRTAKKRAVSYKKRLSLHIVRNPAYSAAKTASTDSSVFCKSSFVCAVEINIASNWAGAR